MDKDNETRIAGNIGFADLIAASLRRRARIQRQLLDSDAVGPALAEAMTFSVDPPYVIAIGEDPLIRIDSLGEKVGVANRFALDEECIDGNRLPQLGAISGVVPSVPIELDGRFEVARLVPVHEDCSIPSDEFELPSSMTRVWNELDEIWGENEYEYGIEVKEVVARTLYRTLQRAYEDLGRDDQKFSEMLEEKMDRESLKNLLERLRELAETTLSDQSADDEVECLDEAVSEVQEAAAEFIENNFEQLRDLIWNFESDIGDFPFIVQRNEDEALLALSGDGSICLLSQEFELPEELLEQELDGFLSIEAPEPIGKLRFIPIVEPGGDIESDFSGTRSSDGLLNLPVFSELTKVEASRESLIWSVTGNPDTAEALRELSANKAQIADVDERAFTPDNSGITPLMQAAAIQSRPFVELLLELGADPNAVDDAGYSPLTYAVQGQRLDNVLLLLQRGARVDPIPRGTGHYSPLALASHNGLADVVDVLVESGADLEWSGEAGMTAVKYAAAGASPDCLSRLIAAGADPIAYDTEGFAAIHSAAQSGDVKALAVLLEAGVDIDLPIAEGSEDEGRTALNYACALGHLEAARYLIDQGAKVNREFPDSATCLSSTMVHADGFDEDREEIVRLLLEHGALSDISASHLAVALYTALLRAPVAIVGLMLGKVNAEAEALEDDGTAADFKSITNKALSLWADEEEDASRREAIGKEITRLRSGWIEMNN